MAGWGGQVIAYGDEPIEMLGTLSLSRIFITCIGGLAHLLFYNIDCEQCSLKMTNIRNYLKIVVVSIGTRMAKMTFSTKSDQCSLKMTNIRVYYIANMKNYVGLFSMLYVLINTNLYTQMTSRLIFSFLFSFLCFLNEMEDLNKLLRVEGAYYQHFVNIINDCIIIVIDGGLMPGKEDIRYGRDIGEEKKCNYIYIFIINFSSSLCATVWQSELEHVTTQYELQIFYNNFTLSERILALPFKNSYYK
ncbi:hypothetical protein ACJX0J_013102, partial [Zea mays]